MALAGCLMSLLTRVSELRTIRVNPPQDMSITCERMHAVPCAPARFGSALRAPDRKSTAGKKPVALPGTLSPDLSVLALATGNATHPGRWKCAGEQSTAALTCGNAALGNFVHLQSLIVTWGVMLMVTSRGPLWIRYQDLLHLRWHRGHATWRFPRSRRCRSAAPRSPVPLRWRGDYRLSGPLHR